MSPKKQREKLVPMHDFSTKLRQPSIINVLKDYVKWQIKIRDSNNSQSALEQGPDHSPISVNLDLTTSCNFRCGHCVDMQILNKKDFYNYKDLKNSFKLLGEKGLKSAIIIGGGEPTMYPKFEEIVGVLKDEKINVAVVTNGSHMKKIKKVAHLFGPKDWVRLSIDAGTNSTFQKMHNPRKSIKLEQICHEVYGTKKEFPNLQIGFSYMVTWKGAQINDINICENIEEIVLATKLARDNLFDYISIKPFLERSPENNAELVSIDESHRDYQKTIRSICESVNKSKELETKTFKVVESTNMGALTDKKNYDYTLQPKNCHMQFFRQILSPLGVFNCPAYRNVEKAKIGKKDAYASPEKMFATKLNTAKMIQEFNASYECRGVSCLYNGVNWFIEDLIQNHKKINQLEAVPEQRDYFL